MTKQQWLEYVCFLMFDATPNTLNGWDRGTLDYYAEEILEMAKEIKPTYRYI